jgi:hypothetical protein
MHAAGGYKHEHLGPGCRVALLATASTKSRDLELPLYVRLDPKEAGAPTFSSSHSLPSRTAMPHQLGAFVAGEETPVAARRTMGGTSPYLVLARRIRASPTGRCIASACVRSSPTGPTRRLRMLQRCDESEPTHPARCIVPPNLGHRCIGADRRADRPCPPAWV